MCYRSLRSKRLGAIQTIHSQRHIFSSKDATCRLSTNLPPTIPITLLRYLGPRVHTLLLRTRHNASLTSASPVAEEVFCRQTMLSRFCDGATKRGTSGVDTNPILIDLSMGLKTPLRENAGRGKRRVWMYGWGQDVGYISISSRRIAVASSRLRFHVVNTVPNTH